MTFEKRPTKEELGAAVSEQLVAQITAAVAERGIAHVVLTGGSMGGLSLQGLPKAQDVDWSKVHFWWGDERFVAAGDSDRNDMEARAAALDALPVPAENIHAMPAHGGSAGDDLGAAARQYALELAAYAPNGRPAPSFDVLMLGVGPDGHIASLFPHNPATRTADRATVAVPDSPKPPPERVSLTFPAINQARRVWFMVAGADKADAVAAAPAPDADPWDVPAAGAHGTDSTVWWVDSAAAGKLDG